VTIAPWIAIGVSVIALFFALRRDRRNAKQIDLEELRRERDECLNRLSLVEGQLIVVRDDNLVLMRRVLGMPS
jgi:hypothetical protein